MNAPRKLDLVDVFKGDAKKLLDARERARAVHQTGNIDASGDEVEKTLCDLMISKLPGLCHVGQGHLVDSTLSVSPQLDLIVADRAATPILFRTTNGTEYVPYECVFAIGEAKTSYAKNKKPIHAFASVIKAIRRDLRRPPTPGNYLGRGLTLGSGFSVSDPRPYKNPLFSFMLFAGGDRFDVSDVTELYKAELPEDLPTVVCILDQGLMVNAQLRWSPEGEVRMGSLNLCPPLNPPPDGSFNRWVFVPYGDLASRAAESFGVLWLMLNEHFRSCVLMDPKLTEYMRGFGNFEGGLAIDLPPRPSPPALSAALRAGPGPTVAPVDPQSAAPIRAIPDPPTGS